MKKSFLLFCFALLFFGFSKEKEVFVCDSNTAFAYHKKRDCEGLKNCTHEIKTMTKKDAKALGRKPCCYCYLFCD